MFVNYRDFNFYLFSFIITFLSSNALFCSNLTSIDDKDTPCFLQPPTHNPVLIRTSGNSLLLPCHVARSKHATVEWWYTNSQKTVNMKIYPVYPAVRPIVLRFVTRLTSHTENSNETDIVDASVLLRNVNTDDSGTYRCVIRPWTMDPMQQIENIFANDDLNTTKLIYQVQITAPRLCNLNPEALPCFSAMRTSSPTVLDAYQTAFLQCLVKNYNRPVNLFWVVGDAPTNNVLLTNYLITNQYNGDQLRRVFPLSPFDYSIEITVNHTIPERTYSCVIDGATDIETTIFTYIIRTIDFEQVDMKILNETHNEEKTVVDGTLHHEQIHSLHESTTDANDVEKDNEEESTEIDGGEEEESAKF